MSTGVYTLIGVVIGGVLTLLGQGGIAWWQARRADAAGERDDEAEWLVASRLLSEELLRLLWDLNAMIEAGVIGEGFAAGGSRRWFDTRLWEQYRPVVARHLPNDDAGNEFWRQLARINSLGPTLRHLGDITPAGTPLPPGFMLSIRMAFTDARFAYESLTGTSPEFRPGFLVPPTSPRVLAVGGAGYLVSVDGTDTETSPSVVYDPASNSISPEASAASHLKMLNAYASPFTGTDEERATIETAVARLLFRTKADSI